MRKTSLNQVYELAKKDERVVFIGSDLGYGVLDEMQRELPNQFFMEGIAEQNVVGMAAGMAMEGKIVYINTIASFLTRRCYEQILLDVAMHNLPVRFIGSGGGLVYAPLGSTHLAFEDISLMRAVPNMTVVAPADANEMARLMPQTLDWSGPIYIRLAKGYDPIVTPDDEDFQIGKGVEIAEGSDVLLVTTGITLKIALEARERLQSRGISTQVAHFHTIKPFDTAMATDLCRNRSRVVVIEEHCGSGGLGELISCVLLENGISPELFRRVALPDVFPDEYGSQDALMNHFEVSVAGVMDALAILDKEQRE